MNALPLIYNSILLSLFTFSQSAWDSNTKKTRRFQEILETSYLFKYEQANKYLTSSCVE
jgi:hypothetical protein